MTKSFLIPTINKDGEISEVNVSNRQTIYDLSIKVPFNIRALTVSELSPRDRLRLELMTFNIDNDRWCEVHVYISEKFRADPRITEEQRFRLITRYVKENASWFFTYGKRCK